MLLTTEDILYTTTKFLQTQHKNRGDRRGNKSTTSFAECGKGQVLYMTTLHFVMMVLHVTTLLFVGLVWEKNKR
jgi:hypothetical protein